MSAGGQATEPPGYAAALEWLFGCRPLGPKLGIERMRVLSNELGDPGRDLPTIHVAGTNGKGSVAAMLEAILRAAGWRVGLHTSPHLIHVGERVQVDRSPLTSAEVLNYVQELRPVSEHIVRNQGAEQRPSFFELLTAMAFLHFTHRHCDIAVIEVGMGGEFDATNIVFPEVSVITSVGLDHCEWLGNTVSEIARTKAGIIKRGRPLVIGRLDAAAESVVREIASARAAPVSSVRETFGDDINQYPSTRLAGAYQRWNAATATLAARQLPPSWRISQPVIDAGLASVRWRGRWESVQLADRRLVLDASHNPQGAEVLETNLVALRQSGGTAPVVIAGVLGAERAGPLLTVICRHARAIHLVVPNQPRALSHAELQSLLPPECAAQVRCSAVEELFPEAGQCRAGMPGDTIVVTGSIYLLGEVLARLQPREE